MRRNKVVIAAKAKAFKCVFTMKIAKINRKLTKQPNQIAFETDPPLTKEVFDKATQMDRGLLSQHAVKFQDGCLISTKPLHAQAIGQIESSLADAIKELARLKAIAAESLENYQQRMASEHRLPLSD